MAACSGHCLCGAVRYKFDPAAMLWRGHCHCESCRRNCSAPFTTWFGVRRTGWRWRGTPPATYVSSPGRLRYFCPVCGTPMAYETDKLPEEIHGYAASLDDPAGFEPQAHFFFADHVDWVVLGDDLPRHPGGG